MREREREGTREHGRTTRDGTRRHEMDLTTRCCFKRNKGICSVQRRHTRSCHETGRWLQREKEVRERDTHCSRVLCCHQSNNGGLFHMMELSSFPSLLRLPSHASLFLRWKKKTQTSGMRVGRKPQRVSSWRTLVTRSGQHESAGQRERERELMACFRSGS